ncbi:unnamed protein product [Triticum aestivum]|uniref:Uncharacterized protein n=2 Tax=Triticum aestivum TaxID=4565 RepID=A0A9R1ERI0_WHEAT|nr:hypothetical protein CFC21_028564 [Triticum aestivum]SPT16785.1 unnamed protein product [Triticum aestivum]
MPRPRPKEGLGMIVAMNAAMEVSGCVRDALATILSEEPRPACLVIDTFLPAAQRAAAELGLPTIVLQTSSAAAVRLFRSNAMLHEKGYLPAQEHELNKPVTELPPVRVSDLFDPSKYPNQETARKILDMATEPTTGSSGIVINTFEALETPELEAIRDELAASGISVFAIGPLHKLSTIGGAGSLLEQDRSCVEWLDTQAAGSVLYVNVSFGSVAPVHRDDFNEVAWGLASSGKPFLWVVRRGLVLGSEDAELPEGFERGEGQGQGGQVGAAAGRASASCGGRILDARWLELDAGEYLRGGPDVVQPFLRRSAGEREVRGGRVGDRDLVGG